MFYLEKRSQHSALRGAHTFFMEQLGNLLYRQPITLPTNCPRSRTSYSQNCRQRSTQGERLMPMSPGQNSKHTCSYCLRHNSYTCFFSLLNIREEAIVLTATTAVWNQLVSQKDMQTKTFPYLSLHTCSFCQHTDENKRSTCQSRSSLGRLIWCHIWQ